MPQAIPIIIGAAVKAAGLTALQAALATIGASITVGFIERERQRRKARDAYNKSLQDRTITIRSGVAARSYVLGTVRASGALQYIETVGTKRQALDSVVAIANNECDLVGYYFNEDYIPAGSYPGSKFGRVTYTSYTESFGVTGTSQNVTLTRVPANFTGSGITGAFWRQGATQGTASVSIVSGSTVSVSGLPAGSSTVWVTYQAATADKLRTQFLPGTATQTVTNWSGYSTPLWTANHRLRGVAHLRNLMIWDENVYQNGAPNVGGVFTGKAVAGYPFYDPRTGTNPATTSNPALLAGWWMTLPRRLGGCGIPSDWIDWPSISVAANICDELITVRTPDGSGYESIRRYECDALPSTEDSPLQNLEIILSSMAGRRVFTAGKYTILAGAFRSATLTLTDSDVVGDKPITVSTSGSQDAPPNIVSARFADKFQNYQETTTRAVSNAAYITSDGSESPIEIPLPATTDPRRAQYLCGVRLEQGRPAFTVELTITGAGENLSLHDAVQLNLTNRSAYSGRTFEVVSITDNWDGTFTISLVESKASTWALDPDTYTPVTPVVAPDNSYLWNPAPLTGFTVSAITPQTLPDGTAVSRVDLAWDAVTQEGNTPGGRIELRYRRADGEWIGIAPVPGDATTTTITAALTDGYAYHFQGRFVNGVGAASHWSDYFTSIDGTPLPGALFTRIRSTSLIFRVPQSGPSIPTAITLTAIRSDGLTSPASWSTSPTVTLGGSGDTRTLSFADMGSNDAVQVTLSITQASVTYSDIITIVKVLDGASESPDLTPPPSPTSLTATAGLTSVFVNFDAPVYSVGGGPDDTVIYAATVTGPPRVFADATPVGSTSANVFAFPSPTGTTWAIWARHRSKDGVLSTTPAGGTNGVIATTGRIGTTDLNPLIVEAGNLASNAVTASKLAAGAVDSTKFASGIEPVRVVTGSLPSTYQGSTVYLTNDGKLYRWNGSSYTAQVAAADVAAGLTAAQIASVNGAVVQAGTITGTQIASGSISTPLLAAGAVQAGNIAAGAVTTSALAADSVTAANIQAGAVGADEIAANAVVAGKIAAAAINSAQIAAGAITTDKLLVTGRGAALNDDPGTSDASAWQLNGATISAISDGVAGLTCLRGNNGQPISRYVPLDPAKTYRVRCRARNVGGTGIFYLLVSLADSSNSIISGDGSYWFYPAGGVVPASSWTEYTGTFGAGTARPFPSNARTMACGALLNYPGASGYMEAQDLRIEEVVSSSLIVDGAITATKLAAGSIAVGSAAIANGAITNAMIANATITSAKIASLDAALITTGTLNADRITAGTITADRLVAGTIDTSRLQDGAATGRYVSQSSSQLNMPSAAQYNIAEVSVVCTGNPVMLFAKAQLYTSIEDTFEANTALLWIERVGTGVIDVMLAQWSAAAGTPWVNFPAYIDLPGAGTHTYRLIVVPTIVTAFSSINAFERALLAVEFRR